MIKEGEHLHKNSIKSDFSHCIEKLKFRTRLQALHRYHWQSAEACNISFDLLKPYSLDCALLQKRLRIMKNLLVPVMALFLSTAAFAGDNKNCSYNCFNTTLTSMKATEDGCYSYTLEVSYSGECTFALSHLTVETTCGTVTALSNSENWKQEIKVMDPQTGLTGFKIDDINEFGKSALRSFTVDVTICPDNSSCADTLSCWAPVVAYKAGQCVVYDSITNQCAKLEASLISENPNCADSSDGSVTIEIADGQSPFSYLWSTGDTTESLSGLAGGNYSVTIYDAHDNTLSLSTELVAPSPISFTYEITNASCEGTDNGAIHVNATGGTAPYTYRWSDGSTASSLLNLGPGQYQVTATDAFGCSQSQSFTVGSVNQISIQAQTSKAACVENNGAIDLSVSGGSGSYTFQWLDGPVTEDRDDLAPGFYTVTVTDEGGCQTSRTFSIKTDNTLSLNGTILPTGCPDDQTGGVNLSVNGATGNVSYLWSTGDTTANLSGVGAGKYEVKVTDESGCSISKSYYVFAETIAIETVVQHPACYGGADGSLLLTSDEEITISWSNGATTAEISGLSEGLYTATVSNAAGCSATLSYYIDAPDEISFDYIIKNETCDDIGYTASLTIQGGTAPFEVVWDDGGTGAVRENLKAGTYDVSIMDKNGCRISGQVVIDASECTDTSDTGDDDPTDDSEDSENTDDSKNDDSSDDTSDNPEEGDKDGKEVEKESPDDEQENNSSNPANEEIICGNPYEIQFSLSEAGDCLKYSAKITYSGEKSFGLSHAVVSTSCGEISGLSTEKGYFEGGLDPTTGVQGLKIDEITGFGEEDEEEQFQFEFEVCNSGCEDDAAATFVVAYKFGQCIDYDTVTVILPQGKISATAYPNPASGKINFKYEIPASQSVQVELYNKYGIRVKNEIFLAGEQLQLDVYNLPNDIYTYRILSKKDVIYGQVMVANN